MSLTTILPFALLVLATAVASLVGQALVRGLVPACLRGVVLVALAAAGAGVSMVVAHVHPLPIRWGTQVEVVLLIVALVLPPLPGGGRRTAPAGTVIVAGTEL